MSDMAAFSLRDNWGVGAAAGVAVSLCVGGWAYASMNRHRAGLSAAPIRPKMATGSTSAPATLDLAAGGSAQVSTTSGAGAPPDTSALVVHVTGSVKKPGVYRLKIGDRINDAIVAAGGFKANARQDVLNLADTVRDADQIFVPSTASLAAKKAQNSGAARSDAGMSYAVPEAPRHALIVRGTPVRTALVSASVPQAVSFDAPASNAGDSTENSPVASADEAAPPAAQPAPEATPGRVLGKPAPVEKGGEVVEEEDEPQAVPAPMPTSGPGAAPSVSKTASTRKTSGSVSKSSGKSGGSSAKFKNPGDGVVHLNRATAQELEKLPGVGPAMSGRILEYRHQISGFRNIEQMLDVKGIGDKKYAKMRPFLAL